MIQKSEYKTKTKKELVEEFIEDLKGFPFLLINYLIEKWEKIYNEL